MKGRYERNIRRKINDLRTKKKLSPGFFPGLFLFKLKIALDSIMKMFYIYFTMQTNYKKESAKMFIRTTYSLTQQTVTKIESIRNTTGLTRSEIVRRAIDYYYFNDANINMSAKAEKGE